ncbi:MAG: hypothetical protein WBO80_03610, partial [Fusicatenibacter saccharivorans]
SVSAPLYEGITTEIMYFPLLLCLLHLFFKFSSSKPPTFIAYLHGLVNFTPGSAGFSFLHVILCEL